MERVLFQLQFYRKGSTGDTSPLPFVAGALNCAVWTKYGVAIEQPALIFVNFIGAVLQISYSAVFYRFAAGATSRHNAVRQMASVKNRLRLLKVLLLDKLHLILR